MKILAILLTLLLLNRAQATTFTTNGSPSDVQAKINSAVPGDTVTIPAGNFTWNQTVTVSSAIHLLGRGSPTITCGVANTGTIDVTFPKSGVIEISGINFVEGNFKVNYHALLEAYGRSTGQPANRGTVLLHDCNFTVSQTGEDCVLWSTNGGVIYNCTFFSRYNDNAGVYCKNALRSTQVGDPWQSPSTLGTADTTGLANTYIEDCSFNGLFLQAVNIDDNARVVIRHCAFNDSAIGSHGQETSPWGLRHFEVYADTFVFHTNGAPYPLNLNYWFEIRGGTGVVFNNTMPDISSMQWGVKASILMYDLNIQRGANNISCQTHYPSARQVGQTWIDGGGYSYPGAAIDGTGYSTDPLYIWGNVGGSRAQSPALANYQDNCGKGQIVNDYIKSGRDYVLAAKTGYAPYAYPHPLRGTYPHPLRGGGNPSSTPTPTVTPGPTPAATLIPSATPAPTPSPTPSDLAPLLGSVVSKTHGHATLEWTENSSPGQGWFEIQYGTSSGHYTTNAYPTSTTEFGFTVDGLKSGSVYYFVVVFIENVGGKIHVSNELSAKIE